MSKQAAEKPSRIAPVEAGHKIQLPEEWAADLGIRLWWLVVRLENWGMATPRSRQVSLWGAITLLYHRG